MTIEVLHPITARVRLPAEYALREAWEALKAAECLERTFPDNVAHQKAADRAYGDMVQAAVRVSPDALRGPQTVCQWVENFYSRISFPNNAGGDHDRG